MENSHQNKLIKQHMVTITGGSGGPLWPVGLQSQGLLRALEQSCVVLGPSKEAATHRGAAEHVCSWPGLLLTHQ